MRYLVTGEGIHPFMTEYFDAESHFDESVNMVVYDLRMNKFTINGYTWSEIQEDWL